MYTTINKYCLALLSFFLGIFIFSQTEFKIPNPPEIIYPINDYSGVLSVQQKELLNQKLIAYNDSTSTEIVVCIVKTLGGDDINYVGAKWGEKWKIGQKDKNNGVLLLLATDDRRLTIQNGRGTEDLMTDYTSSMIINKYMIPYLKQDDYYGAVDAGVDQVINTLQGKFKAKPNNNDDSELLSAFFVLFIILLFILMMYKKSKNNSHYDRNGRKRGNGDDFWGGMGGGFGSSSFGNRGNRSSGSGFGGFGGGGSFGGGGASGSW